MPIGTMPSTPASPSGMSKVLSFADRHAEALGAGLKGIGGMARSDAETKRIEQENRIQAEQYDLQKKRLAALQPLMAALMGNAQGMANNPYRPAPNPYTGR